MLCDKHVKKFDFGENAANTSELVAAEQQRLWSLAVFLICADHKYPHVSEKQLRTIRAKVPQQGFTWVFWEMSFFGLLGIKIRGYISIFWELCMICKYRIPTDKQPCPNKPPPTNISVEITKKRTEISAPL